MTTLQLVHVLRRRWAVVLVGLVLTCAGTVFAVRAQGVYWAQVDVVFLAPRTGQQPNNIGDPTDGVIATAGLVASVVAHGRVTRVPVPDVTIYGEGIRQGVQVTQPNSGGQWAVNFDRAVLDVQSVSRNPDEVQQRETRKVQAIQRALSNLQKKDRIRRSQLITATLAPSGPTVRHVGGDRKRAGAATLLLGGGLTVSAAALLDRRRARRLQERKH